MLSIQQVKDKLLEIGRAQWERLSTRSGVPFSTIKKLAYGQTVNPRGDTLEKLSDELEASKRRNGQRKAA